jgi:hypothetical protein
LVKVKGYYHDLFKGKKLEIICTEVEKFLTKNKLFIKSEIKEL